MQMRAIKAPAAASNIESVLNVVLQFLTVIQTIIAIFNSLFTKAAQ